jgi:hypothetical protein
MLQPCVETGVPVTRQEKILAHIRANPLASYVFSGPPGVGKTTLLNELALLSRAACPKNFALYSRTAMQYQSEATAAARGERVLVVKPHCFDQDGRWGCRWGVYLDDVDKVTGSEFIRKQLFALIDAAQKTRTLSTQLVMSTNMNKVEFSKFFGDAIAWRVAKYCLWVAMERGEA